GGFLRTIEISLHHVGTAHQEQAGISGLHGLFGFRINDADAHARQWMTNASALGANLAEIGSAESRRVDGDHRRAFRASVAFHGADAEVIFKSQREALRQLLSSRNNILQAAKLFRRTAPHISLQYVVAGAEK